MKEYIPSEKFPTVESRIDWLVEEIKMRKYWLDQTSNEVKFRQRTKYIKQLTTELKELTKKD